MRLRVAPICGACGVTILTVALCLSPRQGFHVHAEVTPPVHIWLAWRLQFPIGHSGCRVSLTLNRCRAGFSDWNKL